MEQIRVYNTNLNILIPQIYFQTTITNRNNILFLIPEKGIDINKKLKAFVF
jgi:hypothetical protein